VTATERPDAPRPAGDQHDEGAAQLAALGYRSDFSREMSLRANFALGSTYLPPVVGVYALFAFALAEAGPPMIWSFVIVGAGQLLVALVFGVSWYDNWIVVLSTAVVLAVGLLYMIGARPWEKSAAAAGDAVRGGA
jgi:hypothetical protein